MVSINGRNVHVEDVDAKRLGDLMRNLFNEIVRQSLTAKVENVPQGETAVQQKVMTVENLLHQCVEKLDHAGHSKLNMLMLLAAMKPEGGWEERILKDIGISGVQHMTPEEREKARTAIPEDKLKDWV